MASNTFDTSLVLKLLGKSVDGTLKSPQDALAAAVHATMLSAGYKLSELSQTSKNDQTKLPVGWNSLGPSYYGNYYVLEDSGLKAEIRGVKMGNSFILLGLSGDKTIQLDLPVEAYTSAEKFPIEATSKELVSGFISEERFEKLVNHIKNTFLHELTLGSTNSGYESTRPKETPAKRKPLESEGIPAYSSLEDNSRPSTRGNPFSVGRSDLDPLGGLHIPGPGDGTHVGPSHPMFSHRHDQQNTDIFGGPQTLPRGAVPPGARFDPIGPFGQLPGRGGLGGPRRGFSGEPDNDEMSPPGYNNMFM
ncbi:hypothetical protein CLU79DRAFT_729376 [Phycomyces nitens]|nr:hypothetical protein CLU79DRAFT_729376 [Phycomyces nitens]